MDDNRSSAYGFKSNEGQSPVITFFAKVISYIFHPLFIPLYVTWYLAFVNQYFFTGYSDKAKTWVVLRIGLNMVFFPALTVLLLKGVGFIESVYLKKQKDRIIPYIASGTFFFWMYLVFRNQAEVPKILTAFVFAAFLSSSVSLIANIYFKISMHAVACGGMLGLLFLILKIYPSSQTALPVMAAIFITGLVCSSRLIVSDHSQKEIYSGLVLGILCQFISAVIIV